MLFLKAHRIPACKPLHVHGVIFVSYTRPKSVSIAYTASTLECGIQPALHPSWIAVIQFILNLLCFNSIGNACKISPYPGRFFVLSPAFGFGSGLFGQGLCLIFVLLLLLFFLWFDIRLSLIFCSFLQ